MVKLTNEPSRICVKLIVKNVWHWWLKMCRPIEYAYWMLSKPHFDASQRCPLTEMCEQTCLTPLSVTPSFLLRGGKWRLLNQWSVMHLYGRKLGLCTHTNAATPCSANVSPIQLNGWVMPLPTRESTNKVLCLSSALFPVFFPLHAAVLFVDASTVHSETEKTREVLQCHVSCCSILMLFRWFSRVMSVLVIHFQAEWTSYTSAIFTTMSVCSL